MVALASSGGASASDRDLLGAGGGLPAVERAAVLAASGEPDRVQALYDAARDLQERLRLVTPVSVDCRPYLDALRAAVAGRVLQAEGVDRLRPAIRDQGRVRAAAAVSRAARDRRACVPRRAAASPEVPALTPGSHEAFFGVVVGQAPPGADSATVAVDGVVAVETAPRSGRIRVTVDAAPGPHDLAVTYRRAGRVVGRVASSRVRLLPRSAAAATPFRRTDAVLASELETLVAGFDGIAGAWVQRLADGTGAGANSGAIFPAASTVKLGLLVGALSEMRGDPRRSPLYADLRAMARWSSNLAANRIVSRLGSGCGTGADALAARGLRRLGARVSTFTGCYIVGTELQPAMRLAPGARRPPRDSRRVTSPQDLARMLFAVHAAAVGSPGAARQTGLTVSRARLALGLLLDSEQAGDNRSLVAGGLSPGTPVAQKNGWIRRVRLGAAIAYTASGPVIVAVAAYRQGGIDLGQARRLGNRVAALP